MNILRYIFVVTILLVFSLGLSVEAAKHIIVIYDVSGSMVSLDTETGKQTVMKSGDIHRVNIYLTNLLFTDAAQPLRDTTKDAYIKECDAAYAGKPLYQSGDFLTYATYAESRDDKISRQQVQRSRFQRQLPTNFPGQVSYLRRAEVEVYDELYRDEDDETYWIFVTDEDVDKSGRSDPEIADVLKRHAKIEEEYDDPMICSILVNHHVRIRVRRIQKRGVIETVFIANQTAPNEPVKDIDFAKSDTGTFISETLIIKTNNSDKTKFKLNRVNLGVFDKHGKPLQVVNDDNEFDVLKVAPGALHGHSPPYEFQISLPANPEIAAPGNALKLEIVYDYNGKEKIHPIPLTEYETVIKSIFVSALDNPNQPEDEVELRFLEDSYLTTLAFRSESSNKTAFRIRDIRCHIQYKGGQQLCTVTVATITSKLDEPFQLKVLKHKDLDLYGNKLVLDIDYDYKSTAESVSIELPFELYGGNQGFLMGILIILGIVVLAIVVFSLVHLGRKILLGSGIEHQIRLELVDQGDMSLTESQLFTLANGEILSFGAGHTDGSHFDIGSPAILRCRRGKIHLCENDHDKKGRVLETRERLILTRDEGDEVQVDFTIIDDESQPKADPDPITNGRDLLRN